MQSSGKTQDHTTGKFLLSLQSCVQEDQRN